MFERGKEFAADTATSIDAVQEFLATHKVTQGLGSLPCPQEVDVLCLIQATSPFLQPDFLESGYKLVLQGYDSVFSVTRCKKLRWTEMTSGWVPSH